MTLPDGFQFSQGSLQNFAECRRRFQLLYLKRLAWPAIETEPVIENERYQLDGARFHRMVQQHLLGVPEDLLTHQAQGDDLVRWWGNYRAMAADPAGLLQSTGAGAIRHVEVGLSAPLADYRLVAQYDLVSLTENGEAFIIDWKTSRKRPRREHLAARWQTRLYPYLLARAGAALNAGRPIAPKAIQMFYWFAETPDQPERFPYSAAAFEKDQADLSSLIATIQRSKEDQFPLTEDEKRCAFCVYRSLCERGVRAGALGEETPEEAETSLSDWDFEQIAEIEF
jgi:CRISPR/Cas system-associated exonuclease Cas4 (RecB family)